jgi:hypothetical protein
MAKLTIAQMETKLEGAGVQDSPFETTIQGELKPGSVTDENIVTDKKGRKYIEIGKFRALCPKDWDGDIDSLSLEVSTLKVKRDLISNGQVILKEGTVLASIK